MIKKIVLQLSVMASLVLALAACGGGGGTSSSAGNTSGVLGLGTIVEVAEPAAYSDTPFAGTYNVAVDTPIIAGFTQDMDPASITTSSVTLNDGIEDVPIKLTLQGRKLLITPVGGLRRATVYKVSLAGSIRNVKGIALQAAYAYTFLTQPVELAIKQFSFASTLIAPVVVVADLNGDGRNDLVMVNGINRGFYSENYSVFVFFQKDDGTLDAPVKYLLSGPQTCRPHAVTIGDINQDGKPDVIVGTSGSDGCGIEIFLQTSNGNLAVSQIFATPDADRLAMGDVDGDGLPDLVGKGVNSGSVSVWHQNRQGGLAPPLRYAVPSSSCVDLALGDVNGDGRTDIITINSAYTPQFGVLLQRSDGTMAPPVLYDVPIVQDAYHAIGVGIAVGDLNGDGLQDVAITFGGNRPDASVRIYYQTKAGGLEAIPTLASTDMPGPIVIADLDGDGRNDVVVAHSAWETIGVYFQGRDKTFKIEQPYYVPYDNYVIGSLVVADMNKDGKMDIVVADISGLKILYQK